MKRRPKPRRKIGKRNHCKFPDEKAKGEACGLLTCLKDSGDKKTEDLDWKILRFFRCSLVQGAVRNSVALLYFSRRSCIPGVTSLTRVGSELWARSASFTLRAMGLALMGIRYSS